MGPPAAVPLTRSRPTRNSIIQSAFGGYNSFLLSYGLRSHNMEDCEKGEKILDMLLEGEIETWEEEQREAQRYAEREAQRAAEAQQ